jgi:hypothetical protein
MDDHKKRFSRNQNRGNIKKYQFFKNLLGLGCFCAGYFRGELTSTASRMALISGHSRNAFSS